MQLTLGQRLRLSRGALVFAAVDRAAHALAKVRYAMPDASPERHHVVVHRNVPYREGGDHHNSLDVYIPTRARKPLPVVMYVHGGAFAMLSKETHRVMALAIARRGYLLFNINYRQGLRHTFPTPLEDAAEALLWVAKNAARFGGDPTRIALAGESAGGNLVTALAVMATEPRPEPFARRVYDANISLRAVVSTYPFLDLGDTRRYQEHPRLSFWYKAALFDAASAYLGHRVFHAEHAELASPLRILENGFSPARPVPPFFISCGSRDPFLPQCRRLKEALDRMGVDAELFVAPGEIHAFDAMVWRKPARDKWRATHAFLARHLEHVPLERPRRG